MGAIVLCSHIVLYLIVLCICLSRGIEQCVLWSSRFVYLLVSVAMLSVIPFCS